MMIMGYRICDGNVVVDNYQHSNSHHVEFIIAPLHCIAAAAAAAAAAITPAPVSTTITTAIITATVHGGVEFDQQQEEAVLGDCKYRLCI